jgi:putative FmdB family regulatory protein
MPTYEYECPKCGNVFDEFQSISAPPVASCPKEGCGAEAKRRFSPGGGFLFKGSGFYATDYRSESYKKGAKADNPTPPSCNSCTNASSCPNNKG